MFAIVVSFFAERAQPETPGKQQINRRSPVVDILRIFAAVFVIMLHTMEAGHSGEETRVLYVSKNFLLSCNYLFVMLAGALAYRWKEQKVGAYYYDRGIRILIPMFFYYIWKSFLYLPMQELIKPPFLWSVVKDLFIGNVGDFPHFWILYPIIVIYLSAPFVRYMVKDMSYKRLSACAIIGTILIIAGTMFSAAVMEYLPIWLIVGLIGFWMLRPETRKYDLYIIIAGVLALITMVVFWKWTREKENVFILLSACAVTSLISLVFRKINFGAVAEKVLAFISRYSFGMLLIHWWVLYYVSMDILKIDASVHGILCTLVTCLISFLMAFLFDSIIVVPFTMLLKGRIFRKK